MCAALLAACKKNGGSPKKVVLSKVLVNGNTETEFIYNSTGQLIAEKLYDEHSPYSLVHRLEYIYDASGKLKEAKGYDMPSNKLEQHNVYIMDGQGRMVRNTYYSVNGVLPGTFSTHIDFEYNANGRVSKQTWRDEDENIETWRLLHYYPNGNLRNSESWLQYGGPPAEKGWASSYGPSDTTLPATFYTIMAYPVNFYYGLLTSSYVNHYTYDDDGNVEMQWREELSDRQFNARGLVTQEKLTLKPIKPAGAATEKVLTFEYVEF